MSFRQLKYFLIVAEHENFRRAAEQLYISEPALSRQIAALETELDVQLFERNGRNVRLSDAGRFYRDRTREILENVKRAKEGVRRFGRNDAESLTVGLHELTGSQPIVQRSAQQLRIIAPRCKLGFVLMSSELQLDSIASGALNAGFLYSRSKEYRDFQVIHLATFDSWVIVLPEGHRLVDADTICLSELNSENFVTLKREYAPAFFDDVDKACREVGLIRNFVGESPSLLGFFSLIAAGAGIGIINPITVTPPGVVLRRIADMNLCVYFDFVWHRQDQRPVLQHLADIVRDIHKRCIQNCLLNTI